MSPGSPVGLFPDPELLWFLQIVLYCEAATC